MEYSDIIEQYNEIGLLDFIRELDSDQSEESAPFILDAYRDLEESNNLGDQIALSLEGMEFNQSVIKTISLENDISLDDIALYSFESTFEKFWKSSIQMMKTAFKKLIQAVLNFIQSIKNSVKKNVKKIRVQWYKKNKRQIEEGFDSIKGQNLETSFPLETSTGNFEKLMSYSAAYVLSVLESANNANKILIAKYYQQYKQHAPNDVEIKEKGILALEPTQIFHVMKVSALLTANMKLSKLKTPKDYPAFSSLPEETEKGVLHIFDNPKKAMIVSIYKQDSKPKPNSYPIGEFFTFEELDKTILSNIFSESMKVLVNLSLKISDIHSGVNQLERTFTGFVGVATIGQKMNNSPIIQDAKKLLETTAYLRQVHASAVTMFMSFYGEFMNYHSLAFNVAKRCIMSSKSTGGATSKIDPVVAVTPQSSQQL